MKQKLILLLLKKLVPKHYNGFIIADNVVLNFKVEHLNLSINCIAKPIALNIEGLNEDKFINLGEERTADIVINPYEFNMIV